VVGNSAFDHSVEGVWIAPTDSERLFKESMPRRISNALIVLYVLALVGLGVRSYLTQDSRFGWGMFRNQIDFEIEYTWVKENGGREGHETGGELRGSEPRLIASGGTHRTRYGIGAVKSWTSSYLEYLWLHERKEEAIRIEADIHYQINREGDRKVETIAFPRGGSDE